MQPSLRSFNDIFSYFHLRQDVLLKLHMVKNFFPISNK